jgi:hypothetical protein
MYFVIISVLIAGLAQVIQERDIVKNAIVGIIILKKFYLCCCITFLIIHGHIRGYDMNISLKKKIIANILHITNCMELSTT